MKKNRTKKKIDPLLVKAESDALRKIWEAVPVETRGTQAVFGEKYEIGNQSAVGQYLRGAAPLNLAVAHKFAECLGCQISDFSPRLASLATAWPFELVDREKYESLTPPMRHKAQVRLDDFISELLTEQTLKANGTVS